MNNETKDETLFELLDRRSRFLVQAEWAVGFNDRGMGHGDYAVIIKDDNFDYGALNSGPQYEAMKSFAIKCPSEELAQHIVDLHNGSLATATTGKMKALPWFCTQCQQETIDKVELFEGEVADVKATCGRCGEVVFS